MGRLLIQVAIALAVLTGFLWLVAKWGMVVNEFMYSAVSNRLT